MDATACEQDQEQARVVAWRELVLIEAGYAARDAHELAERTDVDCHRAVELVQRGCPADVAVRILR
jgi:hypothetical protein